MRCVHPEAGEADLSKGALRSWARAKGWRPVTEASGDAWAVAGAAIAAHITSQFGAMGATTPDQPTDPPTADREED